MNTDKTPPPDEAWLEALLRDHHTDEYIDDAGFTARVLAAVPHHNHRRTWLLTTATLVGCAIGWWSGAVDALPAAIGSVSIDLPPIAIDPTTSAYLAAVAGVLLALGTTWWALARRH